MLEPHILANWVYAGTQEQAEQIIRPVLDLEPSYLDSRVIPWNRLSAEAAFGGDASLCVDNQVIDIYGMNLKTLDTETFTSVFERMGDFYSTFPNGQNASVTLEGFPNQGTLATADDAMAYPWRDTKYNM